MGLEEHINNSQARHARNIALNEQQARESELQRLEDAWKEQIAEYSSLEQNFKELQDTLKTKEYKIYPGKDAFTFFYEYDKLQMDIIEDRVYALRRTWLENRQKRSLLQRKKDFLKKKINEAHFKFYKVKLSDFSYVEHKNEVHSYSPGAPRSGNRTSSYKSLYILKLKGIIVYEYIEGCNLGLHLYSESADITFPKELFTDKLTIESKSEELGRVREGLINEYGSDFMNANPRHQQHNDKE